MPRVMIWVREDDLEAFRAIGDRPAWIHDAIRAARGKYPAESIVKRPMAKRAPKLPAPQPLQVNPKSHGPTLNTTHAVPEPPPVKHIGDDIEYYEPLDSMP